MVYVLLAPGFEEMEALTPVDLLRRAGVETVLVSPDGNAVTGGHAITVSAELSLAQVELKKEDMVLLPGGGAGVEHLGKDARVEALVRAAADMGCWLAAICAAPSLLAKWGLLEGKRAVCYPSWADRVPGAQLLEGEKLAVDGTIVTGQAAGASIDFGLKLVELLAGVEKAQEVRHGIYYC